MAADDLTASVSVSASHAVQLRPPCPVLCPTAHPQAQALGRHFPRVAGGAPTSGGPVFCSTSVRALRTAEILLQGFQANSCPIVQSPELLEISLGEWEGRARAECYTDEVMAEILRDNANFAPPGGESLRDVEHRVTRFIRHEVLPRVERGGPPGIVVSHGLAIKCFLRGVLNADTNMLRKITTNNTSITEVAWSEEGSMQGWNILRVNDTSHLLLDGLI